MAITETVQGRYHTIVSDASGVANVLSDLTTFLTASHINPEKVVYTDVDNKVVVFFN